MLPEADSQFRGRNRPKIWELEHNLWNRAGNRGRQSDNRTLTRGKARPMSPFFSAAEIWRQDL